MVKHTKEQLILWIKTLEQRAYDNHCCDLGRKECKELSEILQELLKILSDKELEE